MTDSASFPCEAPASTTLSDFGPPLSVWTDGGCRPNPGFGAWGFIVRRMNGTLVRLTGTEENTTNNRMEMTAVLRVMTLAKGPRHFIFHTDSKYLLEGMTRDLANWKARGWKKGDGKPVLNRDLWMLLDAAAQRHRVEWRWVPSHAGDAMNNEVDALVTQARETAQRRGA